MPVRSKIVATNVLRAARVDRMNRAATKGKRVLVSKGRTRKGRTRKGRTRKGRNRKGRTRKGRTRKGRTRKGRTRKGRTRKGRTRKGRTRKGRARKGCGNPRQQVTAMRDGLGKYVCSVHQHKRKQHASKQYASNSYASKPDATTTGSSRLYARNLDVCTVLR